MALSSFAVSLPLAKSALREPLYTLCYCTAPVFLMATPVWTIWLAQFKGLYPDLIGILLNAYGVVLMIWTAWIGASLLRLHLGIDWGRAVALLGKTYLFFLGLILLLELGILSILGTMIIGPH